MKIVHQVISGDHGGGQQIALVLARAALDAGHDAVFVSPTAGPFLARVETAGIGTHVVPVDNVLRPDALVRYARFLRRLGADLVHTHGHFAGNVVGRVAARLAGAAVVGHAHAENVFRPDGVGRTVQVALDNRTARLCARILAVSEPTRAALERQGYPPELLEVVRNGIVVTERVSGAGIRAELNVPEHAPLVVHVGRLDAMKGQRELLQAFGQLPDAYAVLVGDGPLRAELERRAAELGVAERVRFTGMRDDVAEVMAAADVVTLPSHVEAFGLTLLEAMLQARPVVASAVGGIPCVVVDGETGLLVPPGDSKALGWALGELLSDPARAQRLGDAGRRRVELEFAAGPMAARILEVYDEAVRKMPP
jgi:glycosyltransferase involved in cell wall biosynthesis